MSTFETNQIKSVKCMKNNTYKRVIKSSRNNKLSQESEQSFHSIGIVDKTITIQYGQCHTRWPVRNRRRQHLSEPLHESL